MLDRIKTKYFWINVFGNFCVVCLLIFAIGLIVTTFIGLVWLLSFIGIHGIIAALGFLIFLVIISFFITLFKQ